MFRTLAYVLLPSLLLALAGCGRSPGGDGGDSPNAVELRPAWLAGETFLLREEREQRLGSGPFPSEGEILARTRAHVRLLRNYRVEVLEADGPRLLRARFTYLTSAQEKSGATVPDAIAGKSYLVTYPFDENVDVKGAVGDGPPRDVPREEVTLVRTTALRMAASLLPDGPVEPGATWAPGRDLSVYTNLAKGPIRMVPRLEEIEKRDGRRYARVECETEARVMEGRDAGASLGMFETLHLDLTSNRITSYHGKTEWRVPARGARPEEWRLFHVDLHVESR